MTDKPLEVALREAGLDDNSLRLIAENKLIADLVAKNAKQICENFRDTFMTSYFSEPSLAAYKGKREVSRIPEIAATLRARGKKPTQALIAKALGCTPGNFSKMLAKFPEIKRIFRAATDGVPSR